MSKILLCFLTCLLVSCAGFGEAVNSGAAHLAARAPEIGGGAAAGPVFGIYELATALGGAALAAWGTYERRKRKRAENGR